jgi:EAL domain-containing protein (putative c-di-GMP-specific phosphodiesterase class I)
VRQQYILEELTLWNVEPARLTLEIAEDGLFEHLAMLAPGLRTLRNQGIRILLDDCGAGRVALSGFRDLPVDGIKLDRRLVAGMQDDPFDAYVVAMLIEFAHFLGLEVGAKGVESTAVAERLAELGCDRLQGFGISPALPFDAFAEWRQSRAVTTDS